MTLRAIAATVTLFASTFAAPTQQTAQQPVPQFTDPANLRGERVKPRDGRELPIDQGARGLEQMLRKLNTRASLMLIVAHPDDEDGGMLTYYSRGLGARVAMLTLTRGEGGQNAMTGDFEDALGLLRTQELLSADRYLGVDQFFGTEVDFGFSKTKEEAFKKWTHERVLYDAVRAIRLYRPLVIAAVFIGGVTDGHGQHQVSGQIAQEAFKAAANPTVFPDMIAEGILPWQALKVYARVPMQSISDKGLFDYATGKYTAPRFENYVTGDVTTTTPSVDVIVSEGTVDKLLSDSPSDPPRTYVQFARIGLGLQKSQVGSGMRVPPAGAFDVSYHRYGSKLVNQPAHESNFFDGIDTSITGIADLAPTENTLRSQLAEINKSLNESEKAQKAHKEELTTSLLTHAQTQLLRTIAKLEDESATFQTQAHQSHQESQPLTKEQRQREDALHELAIKETQIEEALRDALGLELDAEAEIPTFDQPAGEAMNVRCTVKTKSSRASFFGISIVDANGKEVANSSLTSHPKGTNLTPDMAVSKNLRIDAIAQQTPTRPYFSRRDIEQPTYTINQSSLRNAPMSTAALVAYTRFSYQGALIQVASVVHKDAQPIQIVPPIRVALPSKTRIIARQPELKFGITATLEGLPSTSFPKIELTGPTDWLTGQYPSPSRTNAFFNVVAPKDLRAPEATFSVSITMPDGTTYSEGYRPVGYGDLRRTNYYTPAMVRIVPVDLNLPATHRIAYLPGTGDAVPEALASINLKPEILTVADLTSARLAQFDTVILGVRTYNAHPDLHGVPTQALLEYARNGGNVVVQYQTAEFTAADAPYPLTLGYGAEKVVDETDAVQLLERDAPFLTTPNKITPADFNGWVEERGHGFLESWDSHYTVLTETHDPDQDPQRGGLITTPLGKGRWTYCAFALYRQLPEAVPGAFRLFVNLINPPAR